MKCVIAAGGKGTRIREITNDLPKPMIRVGGKPVLQHTIEMIRNYKITDIILTVGYKSKFIMDYFGNGDNFGVKIQYYIEKEPLGSAGALYKLKDVLKENFIFINGDIIFDIDLDRMMNFHMRKRKKITIFTHPNNHPYDSAIIDADKDGVVRDWISKDHEKPKYYKNRTNAGIHIIHPSALPQSIDDFETGYDLDRDVIKPLIREREVVCYDSSEYVSDMGTPERYKRVCEDYISGKVSQKSLRNAQRAIFLDRDGTINKKRGFLTNIDDFELIDGVAEAIKEINKSIYMVIVITNQPVIARGEITEQYLKMIHNKMETLLGDDGAYLDDIYYCPHHPDRGYSGEIVELKINCDCRKPKPGMLIKASKEHNIDLTNSWMIGDDEIDIAAGKNAGCKSVLLSKNKVDGIMTAHSLLSAINMIL